MKLKVVSLWLGKDVSVCDCHFVRSRFSAWNRRYSYSAIWNER